MNDVADPVIVSVAPGVPEVHVATGTADAAPFILTLPAAVTTRAVVDKFVSCALASLILSVPDSVVTQLAALYTG